MSCVCGAGGGRGDGRGSGVNLRRRNWRLWCQLICRYISRKDSLCGRAGVGTMSFGWFRCHSHALSLCSLVTAQTAGAV